MNTIASIVSSGIQAGLVRQGNVAHNIANMNTEGAHRIRTHQVDNATGGTQAFSTLTDEPIEIDREIVEQRLAERQIGISARMFHIQDEMIGSLLDVIA